MNKSIDIVKKFLAAENERAWALWEYYLHPEVVYELIGSVNQVKGRENYVSHMKDEYYSIPDWKFDIVNILGDEETVVVEFDGVGHYTGQFHGRICEGAPLRLNAVCIFRFKDNQIAYVREYYDSEGFERQLNEYLDRN